MEKPVFFKTKLELPPRIKCIDFFEQSLREVFFILHPHLKGEAKAAQDLLRDFLRRFEKSDVWIYFPWKKTAVRSLPEDLYLKLRTARNRNLITESEQENYRNFSCGIAGLSVGSNIVSALVRSGGPKYLKLADFDTIEISNLNRIEATLLDARRQKSEVLAQRMFEIDPFLSIETFASGLTKTTLKDFIIAKNKRLDAFIDEMDNLPLKACARLLCRNAKIPVLMATDNGDSVILDIERFDLEPTRPIFHGLLAEEKLQEFTVIDYSQWLRLATKLVSPNYLTPRMQESILEIGKTLGGVPQLGTTAALAGAAVSFIIRRIANKEEVTSGRYAFGLESVFIPHYNTPAAQKERQNNTLAFRKKLGI